MAKNQNRNSERDKIVEEVFLERRPVEKVLIDNGVASVRKVSLLTHTSKESCVRSGVLDDTLDLRTALAVMGS